MKRWFAIFVATAAVMVTPTLGHAGTHVVRVWPVGDSITLGSSWPRSVPGGYRGALDETLSGDRFAHKFVGTSTANSSPTLDENRQSAHDGHGGFRIDQILRDLDAVAHTRTDNGGHWLTGIRSRRPLEPDVALIHIGTNDILQDWDPRHFRTKTGRADLTNRSQRAQFVADMTSRLATLLERIHALRPHCRLVVATVSPVTATQVLQRTAADYANATRRLVSRLRAAHYPVVLADVYSAFLVGAAPGSPVAPGLLTRDGIHPTAAGYAVIARALTPAVEAR